MKQLIILSGKGGTGKTSLTASFAHLAHSGKSPMQAVLADTDVDAPNLELVLNPQQLEEHDFSGGAKAVIDPETCMGCGNCEQVCRFEAIIPPGRNNGRGDRGQAPVLSTYSVDPIACDGCAACVYQCPEQAIQMAPQTAGRWFRSDTRFGPLLHAELRPTHENSGKLVTMVKQQARLLGLDSEAQVVIIDGPPGIGCPVISAASGADLALIVAEPTAAGIHDLDRVIKLVQHFRVPALVCINKADIYPQGCEQIRGYCEQNQIELVGEIPFDASITKAMVQGEPVTAYQPDAPASQALMEIWEQISGRLSGNQG